MICFDFYNRPTYLESQKNPNLKNFQFIQALKQNGNWYFGIVNSSPKLTKNYWDHITLIFMEDLFNMGERGIKKQLNMSLQE